MVSISNSSFTNVTMQRSMNKRNISDVTIGLDSSFFKVNKKTNGKEGTTSIGSNKDGIESMSPSSEKTRRNSPKVTDMPMESDAEEYNMRHRNRGYAVIFNHDKFDKRCEPREGTESDVQELSTTFSSLGFQVIVHQDRTLSEIQSIISRLARKDHSNNDCLVVIVLTHSNVNGELASREGNIFYGVEMLWEPFTSDNCPTLAGKPKLFFIEGCRSKIERNKKRYRLSAQDREEYDFIPPSFTIPHDADFLIAYSTMQVCNIRPGTLFIQTLCEELNTKDNLQIILVRTIRRIQQIESIHPVVPSIISTLTRDIYLQNRE